MYLKCGHLHGYHEWKAGPKESNSKRTCPMCREVSQLLGSVFLDHTLLGERGDKARCYPRLDSSACIPLGCYKQ